MDNSSFSLNEYVKSLLGDDEPMKIGHIDPRTFKQKTIEPDIVVLLQHKVPCSYYNKFSKELHTFKMKKIAYILANSVGRLKQLHETKELAADELTKIAVKFNVVVVLPPSYPNLGIAVCRDMQFAVSGEFVPIIKELQRLNNVPNKEEVLK